jgi:glycolate oxidase subunit GlcD
VSALARGLRAQLGAAAVPEGVPAAIQHDATESAGPRGRAEALVLPGTPAEAAAALAWCYERGVPIVPRGGGTGLAGGAVPAEGGVVIAADRLDRIRALDAAQWRMQAEAGVTTATVRRRAREEGLLFPPDPGAAESSQLGGNLAANAGGPHAFKYGVTRAWVTGIEAAVPPGELITVGGPVRKDAAGYDLVSLLVGSEGTLGFLTAAWLKLTPAPAAALPVAAVHRDAAAGCAAVAAVLAAGIQAAALEYLDAGAVAAAGASFPGATIAPGAFLVLADADGSQAEAAAVRAELLEALGAGALAVHAPQERRDIEALWRWRDGVSLAVSAQRGAKVSDDVVVPADRLAEAIAETVAIGARHGLEACSWGHAGDGNLHATFLVSGDDDEELARAGAAADELFDLAVRLGGSVSGEHGLGRVKAGALARQWPRRALALQDAVRAAFDPKGLMNPGAKRTRPG